MKTREIFSLKILNSFRKLLSASKRGFQKSFLCMCETVTYDSNYFYGQARKQGSPTLSGRAANDRARMLSTNARYGAAAFSSNTANARALLIQ